MRNPVSRGRFHGATGRGVLVKLTPQIVFASRFPPAQAPRKIDVSGFCFNHFGVVLGSFWDRFSTFGRSIFDFGISIWAIFSDIWGPKAARDTPPPRALVAPKMGPRTSPEGPFGAKSGPREPSEGQTGAKKDPRREQNHQKINQKNDRKNVTRKYRKKAPLEATQATLRSCK